MITHSAGRTGEGLVLAFDIGTSSLRTALFDASARRIPGSTAQLAYPLRVAKDGTAELPALSVRKAALECLRRTLSYYRSNLKARKRPIVGAGASCFWHSIVGTDASGRALTPIYTWADSRCLDDAARLRRELDERDVQGRTGCMLRASFWPAKMVWLRRTRRALFSRVVRWMSPAEWLYGQFGLPLRCGYSMASGTGLFNHAELSWDEAMLERCALTPDHLNLLSDDGARMAGGLLGTFPELRETRWFPGIGDGAASNVGSGATAPGVAAINVGTSAAVRVVRRGGRVRAPFGLFCYRVDKQRALIGGAVSNAGNLRQWCLAQLRLPDAAVLDATLRQKKASSHSLTILPFWVSERAPTWPEAIPGVIVGVKNATSALDLFQAANEAVYHRLAQIGALLPRPGHPGLRFIVSGGIQKSRASLQHLCDVLGHPVWASSEPEASIRGAAVFAWEKLGRAIEGPPRGRLLRPHRGRAARFAEARERQKRLEKHMASFH